MVGNIVAADKIEVPLKIKLKAWWNGYDLNDIKDRLRALENNGNPKKEEQASSEQPSPPENSIDNIPWDKLRMEMTQLIWGDGYCGPGGKDHIEKMCKLLTMNSEMSAIVVGAGLGGPSRVLAEGFGVWITGFELSQELAERGMQMSTDAGLASKAAIHPLDPEKENPFDRRYDRAFSKEALYCFPNKEKIIKDVYDTLKGDALFLITDYTLSDVSSLDNPDVQKWLRQEPTLPYPVPHANMKSILEDTGFTVRVNEDISQEYIGLIESSWAKAAGIAKQLATKGNEGANAITSLMHEAEFWALRAKLLKEGHIKVWRFLANKPNEELR